MVDSPSSPRLHARLRGAVGDRRRRAERLRRAEPPWTWTDARCGRGSRRRTARRSRTGSRRRSSAVEARADLLAGDHGGAGPRDARAGDRRRQARRRGLRRRDAGRRRRPPVAARRERRLEAPDARADHARAPFSGKPLGALGAAAASTTSCTRRSPWPTTSSSPASFNLSHSGEKNAENMLEIHDAALAERLAGFVDEIRARYPAITPTRSWTAASR